ncbi:MAG: hypothetical protein ACTS5I_13910 [Rhodanobacter sp.]
METQLDRIEAKLDALIAALAEEDGDDEQEPAHTLDGLAVGFERDQNQSLG